MQSGFIKRIRDIMRMDAGINGDAQRIEQMVWMLFLKVYDAKEDDWELNEDNYISIIPEECRWRNWAQVFKKNDVRTIFNVVYRDGRKGMCFIKRFFVNGCTRDREYDLTQGTEGSRIMYFTANPNGEAEVIKITLEPDCTAKKKANIFLEKDFSEILIKNRTARGNILTKKPVHRISLKSRGHSTLGGRKVWYDPYVRRINYEERGNYLGEFSDDDRILVILNDYSYYFTDFDANNHYGEGIVVIEQWNPEKIWRRKA